MRRIWNHEFVYVLRRESEIVALCVACSSAGVVIIVSSVLSGPRDEPDTHVASEVADATVGDSMDIPTSSPCEKTDLTV